jgi:acetyl-CoA carboxylase carboxyl transferase subunit alpha
VIPEPKGGAHRDPMLQSKYIKEAITRHLEELLSLSPDQLVEDRHRKYAGIGEYTTLVTK